MAKETKNPVAPVPSKGQVVRVHNHAHDGYRRAGAAHPKGAADYAADDFTAEQLEQMTADPQLSVSVVDAPKAGADKK